MARPTNVTKVAGLHFFHTGIGILMTLALLLDKPFRDRIIITPLQEQFQSTPNQGEFLLLIVIFMIGLAILLNVMELLFGYGLLKRKNWAWFCTLILHSLIVLGNLISFFAIQSIPGLELARQTFQLITSGSIIYFLFRPDVKPVFDR